MRASVILVFALSLALAGCASVPGMTPNWSVYRVSTVNPKKPENDPTKFSADKTYCQSTAEGWLASVATSDVVISTGRGALQNSSSLNPIAIGVGAVAGAADSILAQSGVSLSEEREQFIDCIQRRTDKDGAAFVPKQR